jgi:uncharacterized protein YndB with AHSA1/START domain
MTAESEELSLHLVRVLPAPRSVIFSLHAEPEQWARWWGPRGFTVPRIEVDLRVGGSYRIEMQPPEGDSFALVGEFRRIEAPELLSYTFRWEPPDPDDQETVVDFSLRENGDGTEVTVDQRPFRTESRRELHTQGWTDTLDRLGALVANERRTRG